MTQTRPFASQRYAVDDIAAAQEFFHARNWSDGLPIVPPTAEMVGACLDWALLPADHLIGVEPVRERAIVAEKVAINAVMAGCLPMHFPVVVAAITAMLQAPFVLHGATSSTGGCAVLIIINGPVRQAQAMDATFSALGPSDRATTVIGRAVRLVLCNLLDVRPGEVDRSTLGHPGKISYCLSEDEEHSSWLPLAEERGIPPGTSAVTVLAAGAPRQIMNEWTTEPDALLDTYVAEIKACMRHYSIWSGNYAIVVPPQLRTHFDHAGWSKADIRDYVHHHARIRRHEWAEVGKGAIVADKGEREYAALPTPDHLLVIAAGGPAGGFGAVIPPWFGKTNEAVTIAIGACVGCEI